MKLFKPKFKVGDKVIIWERTNHHLPDSLSHYGNRVATVVNAGRPSDDTDLKINVRFEGSNTAEGWSQVWFKIAPLGKQVQARLRVMYGKNKK